MGFIFIIVLLNLCGRFCANWFPETSHVCVSYSMERYPYVVLAIVINREGVYSSPFQCRFYVLNTLVH